MPQRTVEVVQGIPERKRFQKPEGVVDYREKKGGKEEVKEAPIVTKKFNRIDEDVVASIAPEKLSGKERFEHKCRVMSRLGIKPPKKHKLPYNVLQGSRKKQKKKEKKDREQLREAGVLIARKPKVERERKAGLKSGFGSYQGGVLRISRSDADTVTKSKRLRPSRLFKS